MARPYVVMFFNFNEMHLISFDLTLHSTESRLSSEASFPGSAVESDVAAGRSALKPHFQRRWLGSKPYC